MTPYEQEQYEGEPGDSEQPAAPEENARTLGELNAEDYSGGFYSMQTLYDPVTGVEVMRLLLPTGWTGSASVNWEVVSTVFPGFATVTLNSPGGDAAIIIHSAQSYYQGWDDSGFTQHYDHADMETYTTYLRYMNAEQVLQYHFENVYGTGCELIKQNDVSPELQAKIDALAQSYSDRFQADWTNMASRYGVSVDMRYREGCVADNRYRVTASDGSVYYAEACCYTVGVQYDVISSTSIITQLPWQCPEIIILMADSEQTLDEYYEQYRTIFANVDFSNEFYYLNHMYATQLQNAVMNHLTAKTAAMNQTQAEAMLSDYQSGSYSSDDWANDWSDYIYDRNEYTASDGSIVEASTAYDSVYQNGNDFYMGPYGSAPYGWTELERN